MSDGIETLPPRVRKPSLKRRLAAFASDDEDDDEAPPSKRTTKQAPARPPKRAQSIPEESTTGGALSVDIQVVQTVQVVQTNPPLVVVTEDMDVDIEGDAPAASSSTSQGSTPGIKKSSLVSANSAVRSKRKRNKKVVYTSDEESVDEYDASRQDTTVELDDDWDTPTSRTSKDKGKFKEKEKEKPSGGIIRTGKGILSTRIPKKKPTKDLDDKPIMMKDESKASSSSQPNLTDTKEGVSKAGESLKTVPSLPPKPKLPPIPKKKPSNSYPTATVPGTTRPSVTDPMASILLGNAGDRQAKLRQMSKQSNDVDLSQSDIYAELFKGTSTSKATSVRAEERRKELYKMRDEARAKREATLKTSFDLQASLEKIARFEDKWRQANRPIFFPSCLGGALYERHKATADATA